MSLRADKSHAITTLSLEDRQFREWVRQARSIKAPSRASKHDIIMLSLDLEIPPPFLALWTFEQANPNPTPPRIFDVAILCSASKSKSKSQIRKPSRVESHPEPSASCNTTAPSSNEPRASFSATKNSNWSQHLQEMRKSLIITTPKHLLLCREAKDRRMSLSSLHNVYRRSRTEDEA